jgi:type IV pilus assembly protein PilQ
MKKIIMILNLALLFALADPCFNTVSPQETAGQSVIIESMEFREVDIKDILRQLAKQYDLNIVFSESVKGLVTVQLNNVSVEQALDSVVTVNGFAYTKKDNVYKVTSQEEAQREGKQTKLFKLNNADATKLKDTLAKVLSTEGAIDADSRSNSIIVTDSVSVVNKIEALMPTLDEITPQVLIEAKMIETSLNNSEKLGIDWQTTIKAIGSKRPTTFPFRKWGSDKDYYPVPSYTSVLNNVTGQIEVTSDFPFGNEQYLTAGKSAGFGSFPMVDASYFTFGTLDFSSLQTVFDFLKQRSNTKLVANPRIVTLNNQNAKINVGKVLSLPTYERNSNTGNLEITGWTSYNVGVNLDVTPQVSPDGHIKLKLKPEVSSLVGYASSRDGVQEGPITSSRSAITEVQIRDGQTVVIGGLVKDDTYEMEKKIPFLGDLPFLGWMFKRKEVGSTSNPTEKTDLLIFVTARIIKDTDEPLIAKDSNMVTSLEDPRPFKLEMRGQK